MSDYMKLLDAVEQYYGSGSDEWAEIAKYGVAADHAEEILRQVPGVNIIKNSNGSIRSYNFSPVENITSTDLTNVNSNVPAENVSFSVPATTGVDTAGKMTFESGLKTTGTAASASKFVFGEVVPAVAAASAGITLGKTIDSILYNVNPDFWDEHGMETLNPDTWNTIVSNDSFGGRVFNMTFGLNPEDNTTQAYMDENALAYMALYLQNKGVFSEPDITISKPVNENFDFMPDTLKVFNCGVSNFQNWWMLNKVDNKALCVLLVSTDDFGCVFQFGENSFNLYNNAFSKSNFNSLQEFYTYALTYKENPTSSTSTHTYKGKTKYVNMGGYLSGWDAAKYNYLPENIINNVNLNAKELANDITYRNKIFDYLVGGTLGQSSNIDGIGTSDNAKTPDLSSATTPEDVLKALKEQYPELWKNAVTQDVVQPDGSTVTYTYVPVAMPNTDTNGNPVSDTSTQADPKVDPATAPETLVKLITTIISKIPPINPPDTGSGDTPVVPPVSGSASALYAIYNPTLSEINSFGAWLWSDSFIEQIKKLFSDPMQAIIGLHKVFATPATGGKQNIKVGYLDSGVSANVVTNQYTTIDCGTVKLYEQFHNVFDYGPYTQVNLYLPFIGIVNLDVADVMRASIHIIYHVDVLSGACLAEVKVQRDSAGGTLYQYAGNASVTLPISSGSYMGIVTSLASIAGGVAGTIASGGAMLPMLASAAGSALNARTRVEHSGSFSGNAGAMGSKKPYLIISRPQTALADNFEKYIGYPANFTQKLSSCTGYVKVIESHLENVNATDSEISEIDNLLKEGVLV